MKIVYIVPGTGGQFYCQNCMRDAGLVKALRGLKHDIVIVPMYLPLAVDDPEPVGDSPIFYSAISCYLKQKYPVFRKSPPWLEWLLGTTPFLRLAASRAGTTSARGLEKMTISVLKGADGNQHEELDRLIDWLKSEGTPDVVHLSNALLLGLAPRIRDELDCAVVCSLQDELPWIETMDNACVGIVRDLLAAKARSVDAFIPVSDYYAALIQPWLGCEDRQLHVVHIGIDPEGYRMADHDTGDMRIGFLSRMGPGQGLDRLAEAFALLKQREEFSGACLALSGGTPPQERKFIRNLKQKLQKQGLLEDVLFLDDFGRQERQKFLSSLSVMSVSVPGGDAFGLYLVEAMASGVPVVQPREGSAVEIVERSGGGILCEPDSVESLAAAIGSLLRAPLRRVEMGRKGHDYVMGALTNKRLAEDVSRVYDRAAVWRREG